MSTGNSSQILFCGILLCISITALIIACLTFTNKGETFERGGQHLTTSDGACCGTWGSPADQKGQCYDANTGNTLGASPSSKEECERVGQVPGRTGPLCGTLNKWDTSFQKCPGQCSCMGATPPDCTCTGGEREYPTCHACGGSWFGAPPWATKTQKGVCWGPHAARFPAPAYCRDRTSSPSISTKEECMNWPGFLGCGTWVDGRLCDDNTGGESPCL